MLEKFVEALKKLLFLVATICLIIVANVFSKRGLDGYLEQGQERYDAEDYAGAFEKWYLLAQGGDRDASERLKKEGVCGYLEYIKQFIEKEKSFTCGGKEGGQEDVRALSSLDGDGTVEEQLNNVRPGVSVEGFVRVFELYRRASEDEDEDAARQLEVVAEGGNKIAQDLLGDLYKDGEGVAQNYEKAAEWYGRAAEQDYPWAQLGLGRLYYQGRGVDQDYARSAELYESAAKGGNRIAQDLLGDLYKDGEGVTQNYEKAAEWYERAAEQDYHWAQLSLGLLYYEARIGDKPDYEKAAYWFELAASNGNSDAVIYLALATSKQALLAVEAL